MSYNNSKQYPTKPLKGGAILSNYGSFDTLTATTLIVEDVDFSTLVNNGFFTNADVANSKIENTTIGLNIPSIGYFTELKTFNNVSFISNVIGATATWDVDTGVFYISSSGSLEVAGCSKLGNIKICNNDIKADNTNGDINIIPNGIGSAYVYGPLFNSSSHGSLSVTYTNGGADVVVDGNMNFFSSSGNYNVNVFGNQNLTSNNGDVNITTDAGVQNVIISTIVSTLGNIVVTTALPNGVKSGDVVSISGNSTFNGAYTVGNVLSDNVFRLTTTTGASINGIGGLYIRTPNNVINLNSSTFVKIPSDTKLSFGATCNSISASTSAMMINSCNDIQFVLPANNVIRTPEGTKLQFGTSGSNYINVTSGKLNINSANTIAIDGVVLQINTTNTRFYDPILTIGDYTAPINDTKDRGVEFRYYDVSSGSTKLGWFGYKSTSGSFAFLKDVTNTNETISGGLGNIEANTVTLSQLRFNSTSGNSEIDMSCGVIKSVSLLQGCSGDITIRGSNNVTMEATNRIHLSAGNNVLIPTSTFLLFGTSGSYVRGNTIGNIEVSAQKNVTFTTQTNGSVTIPIGTRLTFDGTSAGSKSIFADTAGDLNILSNNNLYLTPSSSVIIPYDVSTQFGSSTQTLTGRSGGITLATPQALQLLGNSNVELFASSGNVSISAVLGDINLYTTSGNVRVSPGKSLVFGISGTSNSVSLTNGNLVVRGNDTNQISFSNSVSINLTPSIDVNIPTSIKLNLSSDKAISLFSNSAGNLAITNGVTNGSINISSNSATNITSSSFNVVGNTTRINTDNLLVKDPIITISHESPITNDLKDRGIEFKYFDTSAKLGWFGYKNNTGRFTYLLDAANSGEIITGTKGDVEVGTLYLNNMQFSGSTPGSLNMACGSIVNANTVSGCSGVLNLRGSSVINMSASDVNVSAGALKLSVTDSIRVPYNVPFVFDNVSNSSSSSNSNSITCNTVGHLTMNASKIIMNADVQINGTTTNIHSTVTNLHDPIFSLGGVIGPIVDDGKDRGVEFKWFGGASSKTGFFGYKNSIGRFVFIKDGTNNNEVFSGSYGDIQVNNVYGNGIILSGSGVISGVSELSGGAIQISTSSGNITISPTSGASVVLPYETKLVFGNTQNSIYGVSSGALVISSGDKTVISTGSLDISTTKYVSIPGGIPIYIGDATIQNSNGNLGISTINNILLNPSSSGGSVIIPEDTYLEFGSNGNSIYSDGDQLLINGYNGVSISSGNITISGTINIEGELSTDTYIFPLGTSQTSKVTSIVNSTVGSRLIIVKTNDPHYLSVNDKITLKNTNSVPVVDGEYTVNSILDSTRITVSVPLPFTTLTTSGTDGILKGVLKVNQGKDVGISVNYWADKAGNGVTAGSINSYTGFFGYKLNTDRWTFYDRSIIMNDVVTGTLGNIDVNKVFTNKMSGFILEGGISGGSNAIAGSNFVVAGGSINNTPIGGTTAAAGRFTTLSSTVEASFNNVTLQRSLVYSIERYTVNAVTMPTRNPTVDFVVSLISVSGANYTTSSGTMPSLLVADGTYKILTCASIGTGCAHTIHFGIGKIIAPSHDTSPSKLVFKRAGQSAQLMFSAIDNAWILINSGAYVT
uniref:Uncharacterized protein n=1 Tax=viral metagenome TaxID=1070528 RepID=A0A6C0DZ67_9ZZZZ